MLNLVLVKGIADARIPEVVVPAGFNQVVYETKFTLSADTKNSQCFLLVKCPASRPSEGPAVGNSDDRLIPSATLKVRYLCRTEVPAASH
jgi:hypothetical protein